MGKLCSYPDEQPDEVMVPQFCSDRRVPRENGNAQKMESLPSHFSIPLPNSELTPLSLSVSAVVTSTKHCRQERAEKTLNFLGPW